MGSRVGGEHKRSVLVRKSGFPSNEAAEKRQDYQYFIVHGVLRYPIVSALCRIQSGARWNHAVPGARGRGVRHLRECGRARFGSARGTKRPQGVHRISTESTIAEEITDA